MSEKQKNSIISFLASVKLALFLLISLAATSIIGTLIPQNGTMAEYSEKYGPELARFFERLSLFDMYTSWWFLALLAAFSINLIVCSLDRIPGVWQLITKDNLTTEIKRLQGMGLHREIAWQGTLTSGAEQLVALLAARGWRAQQREKDGGVLLFAQKGAWTRFGVYLVHFSILIILAGAIIGSSRVATSIFHAPTFAFKGSVMLPETSETDVVYSREDDSAIPLGFTIRCDLFSIEYYNTGMAKDYLSKLTVLENGREVLHTQIEVNQPLTYKGITFYQSSYRGYQDLVVELKNEAGVSQSFVTPVGEEVKWPQGGASFGILDTELSGEAIARVKVWFNDTQGPASIFWIEAGREALVQRPAGNYTFTARQLYATGLEVNKDPGVGFVYSGCCLMLLGLFVAFFMSHRKVWIFIREERRGRLAILVAGNANKNKLGYEKQFATLVAELTTQR